MINVKEIKETLKKEGFSKTWKYYSNLIPEENKSLKKPLISREAHPLMDTLFKIRKTLISMGFEEIINPIIIPEDEIYKQYGPEAPIILDRIYYLAGLPRPDRGLSKSEKEKLLSKGINVEKLQEILRKYRSKEIEAEDLIEIFKSELNISDNDINIILEILKDFFELKPIPYKLTLRSHMTGAWFKTLTEILIYREPPLWLFSIGMNFRREQKEDSSHLFNYHSVSIIIVDENLSVKNSFEITNKILRKLGFKNIVIKRKDTTSRYYAFNKEWEVFVKFNNQLYEIGTFGFYSPVALANYNIEYPVYNFGMGLERLVQILMNENDIRKIVYRHRYFNYTDCEIKKYIYPIKQPKKKYFKKLKLKLSKLLEKYKDKKGPFKEKVYENKNFEIYFIEQDKGKNFLGKATFNWIYIEKGNILSSEKKPKNNVVVGRYIDFILDEFLFELENGFDGIFNKKWVEGLSDVNLTISKKVLNWMIKNNKKIQVYGPVFIDLEVKRK